MTLRERLIKNLLFVGIFVYYLGGYMLINWLTSFRVHFHYLDLPFEKDLPFLPALIFAYILHFAFISFTYVYVDDLEFFKKVIRAFFICVTFHFIVFAIFPVELNLRPEIDPTKGWAYQAVAFYYWLDLRYNCFPSMHISNAFLIAFILQRYRAGLGWIFQPLAVLIAISVVMVKQHYIVDVVAGFFVGWGVYWWVFRKKEATVKLPLIASKAWPDPGLY